MRRLSLALALAATVSACAVGGRGSTNLTLFVASSLSAAIEAVTSQYTASHAGVTFTISTGSSTALRTQIEQGGPADVLLSADTKNPQALVDGGLADGAAQNIAANKLAIVVPKGNPAGLTTAFDLGRQGVRLVAAGDGVPISSYAIALVRNLNEQPGAPPGLVAAYVDNVISQEEDVKAVLAKVELGEADAAIVYATDARGSGKVDSIPIPDAAQVSATYGGVVVKASKRIDAAREFLTWLAGPDGQHILATFGFSSP